METKGIIRIFYRDHIGIILGLYRDYCGWGKSCTILYNPNNGSYSALGILSGARVPPSIKRYPIQPVHKPSTAPI